MSKSKIKAREVRIAVSVLNALAPQTNLVNASSDDLMGKTFLLQSTNVDDVEGDLTESNDNNVRIKATYVEKTTGKALNVNIRSLLNFDTMLATSKNETFKEGETETSKVYAQLINKAEDSDTVGLPEQFDVVHVEPRKTASGKTIYPYWMYQKYQDRVKAMQDEHGENFNIGEHVLSDRDFINGLYENEEVDARHGSKPEATKRVVLQF